MSILNKIISYYPSKSATTKGVDVNLLTLLQSDKHRERIINLRASTEEVQKQLKDNLSCFTVAGTFNPRSEDGLIELSGLAAVDLDSAEDYDIECLLKELQKIRSIAYAGLSCRGKRLFCIVPLLYPDKYARQYERLTKSFIDMGLPMGDECHKTLSQPRFISWSENDMQFFNHDAVPYHLLQPEKSYHHIKQSSATTAPISNPDTAFAWCNEQINKSHEFVSGKRHEYIKALARYCNIKGIPQEDTLYGCLNYVQQDFDEKEITCIVKHIYTSQADSHNKLPFRETPARQAKKEIQPKEQPVTPPPPIIAAHYIQTSFIGTDGRFYIPNPVEPNRFAVYESENAYNDRQHIPTYISSTEAEKLFFQPLQINLSTLKTVAR